MIVEMLLAHFITMAGVHVIIRWAISCAEILSAELGDDDCLVGWLSALASQTGWEAQTSDRRQSLCCAALGTMLTVPQDSGLAFLESWCTDIFTGERVEIDVAINQGRRFVEVPPYDWRPLPRDTLWQSVKEIIAYMTLPPCKYTRWSGPMVQNWRGVSRCSRRGESHLAEVVTLWETQQLHQNIIASRLPGTVYMSLTIGYPSP